MKIKKGATKIFDPEQFGKLMKAAQEYDGGSMLAYFALCTFAGIRPAELRRLRWDGIDFGKGHV